MATAIVKTYANLVNKGKKTLDEVPTQIRADVEQYMREQGWLTTEEV